MPEPITRVKGDDWRFPFTWRTKAGAGIDITGYTVGAAFYRSFQSEPEPIEADGVTIVDAAAGKFEVEVPRTITSTLSPDRENAQAFPHRVHVYVTDPDGNRETLGIIPLRVVAP